MKEKRWLYKTILYLAVCLGLFGTVMIVVDPYFHYHKPIKGTSYRLYEERYVNDGIARNFEYDAIIIGTSMAQNFKTSEFNELFDCESVKLPFSGAGYQEISHSLQRAFSYNDSIGCVLWGLDCDLLIKEPDYHNYEEYPDYLYDNNPWNDVNYIFNKDLMYHGSLNNILMTILGKSPTTFDEYSAWEEESGYKAVMKYYSPGADIVSDRGLSQDERRLVEENIRNNICTLIEQHPDTTFHLFFTPYSIVYWDKCYREGSITAQIEAQGIAINLILQYPNANIYCFNDNLDLTTNLDYYKDTIHYTAQISSRILQWISEGEYQVTSKNFNEHIMKEKEAYKNYNYDAIFKTQ